MDGYTIPGQPQSVADSDQQDEYPYNPLDPNAQFNTARKAAMANAGYGGQLGDYGSAPTASWGSMPSPAQERYQQMNAQAAQMKAQGHDPYTAQPAWWRTLIAAAAQFGTRRNPALGKTISEAITGRDPNVQAAQSYFGRLAQAKQAADEERQQQVMQQTGQFHRLMADTNRLRALGTAQNQQSMEQARLETADKAKTGEGFQQYQGLPTLAPPSDAGQAPTVTPQSNGLPPLLGPGQAPIPPAVRGAMAANAPPAPTNRIAGYTPARLSTGQQGQIPTAEDRANSELISQDLAQAAGRPEMALQRVPPAERTRLETLAQQRDTLANKPDKLGTPEQQFIDEYRAAHKGATIAEALTAFKKIQPPEKSDKTHVVVIDPATNKLVELKPGDVMPKGAISPQQAGTENMPTTATRNMAEKAPRVIHFVDRINTLLNENEGQLGPLKSRWSEFTAGKVGLPNKGFTQIRTDAGLLETALMNMHVGARGGERIMEHFHNLINTGTQDPDNLRAALGEIRAYAQEVAKEAHSATAAAPSPTSKLDLSKFER